MEEIIDRHKPEPGEFGNLRKSGHLLKISSGLVLFLIVMSVFNDTILIDKHYYELSNTIGLIMVLNKLAVFILGPLGLFYSLMGYKRNEGNRTRRLCYFLGHLFICFFLLLALDVFLWDLEKIFNNLLEP